MSEPSPKAEGALAARQRTAEGREAAGRGASGWDASTLSAFTHEVERAEPARLDTTRFTVLVVGFVANAALLTFASHLGMIDTSGVLRYAASVALLLTAAWLVTRSGYDAGPLQWLALIVPGMVAMYQLQNASARGAFLLLSAAPLAYEMLELSKRRFFALATGYAVAYAAMLFMLRANHPARIDPAADKLLAFALVGVVVIVTGLRAHMRERRIVSRRQADELSHALTSIAHAADHDALTGLVNRRFLSTFLDLLTSQALRGGGSFAIAMLDLDHFKRINDDHGHQAGDRVLQRVANALASGVRSSDSFGRWGGEEFLLVMPQTTLNHARVKAEQLRSQVEGMVWSDVAGGLRVTVSVGVGQWRPGEAADALIARIDAALYAAKHHGRNRVEATAEQA